MGEEIGESGQRDRNEPDCSEQARATASEQVGKRPDRRGPERPTQSIPEQEPRPPHPIGARKPGRDDPEAGQPTSEKDRSRPVSRKERLPTLDQPPASRRPPARPLEQPPQPPTTQQITGVISQNRSPCRNRDHERKRQLPLPTQRTSHHQTRLTRNERTSRLRRDEGKQERVADPRRHRDKRCQHQPVSRRSAAATARLPTSTSAAFTISFKLLIVASTGTPSHPRIP